MHICAYQEAPAGLVVFMRPSFSDCSFAVPMNIQWDRREGLSRAQERRKAKRNVPDNSHSHRHGHVHIHTHTLTQIYTHTHTLQQWEERATVTNSSGATKVAGNLSNGTIK